MIKALFLIIKIWLLCLVLVFPHIARAQLPHTLWFHPLTAEEGLSQNYNWYVYHDSEGFVWISSVSGLSRFDGVNIEPYNSISGDSTTLLGEIIHSEFFEDERQNIWFSTLEAIHCYLRQQDIFRRYPMFDHEAKPIPGEYQVYFLEKDSFLWVGNGAAIYRFDIHHPTQAAKKIVESKHFRCRMELDAEGSVRRLFMFNTMKGLKIYAVKNGELTASSEVQIFFPNENVWEVLPESDTCVWLITEKYGLVSMNPNGKGKPRIWGNFASSATSMALWGDKYLILVAKGRGVFFIDKKGGGIYPVSCKFIGGDDSAMQTFKMAHLDKEENLWISDEMNGLHYANLRKTKLRSLPKLPSAENSKNYSYWAIEEDKSGNVWLGAEPGGVFLLNKRGQLIRRYAHQPGNRNTLPANWVRDVLPDSKGNIWMATTEGLAKLIPRLKKISLIPAESGKTDCVINQLYLTKSGRLLATSEGQCSGVYELREIRSKKRLVKILSAESGDYQTFFEDKSGKLYCVRNSEKICVFNFENNKLVLKDSFPVGGLVNGFYEEGDNLYFATSNGLVKIDKNRPHDKPVIFTEADGLPGNFIGEMLGLSGQKLWLGTNKGLVFFDGANDSIRTFSLADGAQSLEFHITAAMKRSNGELWFGGSNGITIVPAEGIPARVENAPKVFITNIKINDEEQPSLRCHATGTSNVTQIRELVLPYDSSTISFEFVAIEYSDPANNKLEYRLFEASGQPYDDSWLKVSSPKGFARYLKLPHGKYVFKVRGYSSEGVESRELREIFITITPPFYLTREFFALCALAILVAGYFILNAIFQYQLREKNLQLREQSLHIEKQDALTQERNRIAGEMHDDLGGGLTSIRMLSSRVQKNIDNPEMQGQVDKIAHYSQELVQKMGEIIWAMNSNFDTVGNLIAYIRRYAVEFLDLSGLRYHIREPEEALDFAISGERRRNIYLAVKESLHNVVKHANAERVSISFEIKNENLVVQVQDDGKGIDPEKVNEFGNGLHNMRKRLRDIGGEMLTENRDGALLTFIVPLEKSSPT
jgi:signal transduction histidine kinase/ligand-binding sensor domain-containing protein